MSSEYEAQQEAERIIASFGGLGEKESSSSKYATYQPPVAHTSIRAKAIDLILCKRTLLRAEKPVPGGSFAYVFAGTEASLNEALEQTKKAAPVETATTEAARNRAAQRLNEAEMEYNRRQRERGL
jgi:hypothetical protein